MSAGTTPQSPPVTPRVKLTGVARLDAMSTVLARNWWLVALRGVGAILFGVLALIAPGPTMLTLVLFLAAYMLVDGVVSVVAAVRQAQRHERWGFLLAGGLLSILAGIAAFLVPGAAIWAAIYLLAFWALASGSMMLASAFSLHKHYGRWWLIFGGLASVLFGIALLINPGISALLLTWWLGGYAIAFGIFLVILSFSLRGRHHEAGRPLPTGRSARA